MVVATRGASTSKPRPAVVVQSDLFTATHASVTICPVTADVTDAPLFRITVLPGSRSGLTQVSQVMVDKVVSVPREAIGRVIGQCDENEVAAVDDALRNWLAL